MRIVSIQDLSCLGQCSSTVALPIISALGAEVSVLPSALLSTHTTSFTGYTVLNLTDEMEKITEHWIQEKIEFDGMLIGYIADVNQFEIISKVKEKLLRKDSIFILDPAMADDGELYPGLDDTTVQFMKKMSCDADVLLPNMTEACLMTGTEYKEKFSYSEYSEIAHKLKRMGAKNVILTGFTTNGEDVGAFALSEAGEEFTYTVLKREKSYPGTGDVFTSVVSGLLFRGEELSSAIEKSCKFVGRCIDETVPDESHYYGVKFEEVLRSMVLI